MKNQAHLTDPLTLEAAGTILLIGSEMPWTMNRPSHLLTLE